MVANREIVLVVEDDPDVLELATEAVRNLGYEPLAAPERGCGSEYNLGVRPNGGCVVHRRCNAPGMNGVELAHDARGLRPTLRVLLASGYPREALRDSIKHGMFITKPYTMSALGESLVGLSLRAVD
jgi:DNA-binding NtrC family response regulator